MSEQPIPETCSASGTRSGQLPGFLFGLAPDGVFRASAITLGAVGSYPAFSPLPGPPRRSGRFKFLRHFPSKGISAFPPRVSPALRQRLRGIAPSGVRTFLPRLAPEAILRPSKIEDNLPVGRPVGKRRKAMRPKALPSHATDRRGRLQMACSFDLRS